MSKLFLESLWKAINKETETDTLICQVQAAKEIIDEVGGNLLTQETVDAFAKLLIDMYHKSDDRIKENNELAKNETVEDEDDQIDQDDLEVIKEENNNEFDLQLSIAEIVGIIFKTHGPLSGNLINELFANILPAAMATGEKQKTKFALFIMDDMVEFLGPELLGPHYITVAKEIIKFCGSATAAVRQAASYGIGIMAEKSGAHFAHIANDCLLGLKTAIEYQMPGNVKEKKPKVKQFKHAKDNAVSALGKIIRFQAGTVDVQSLIPNWLGLLPIKADVEEAKTQNEYLATLLTENPILVLGE
jgi:importin-5